MKFNTLRSSENDTYSPSNAKRLVGAAAVVGAVFAGGCEANQNGDVRHYSAGTGALSGEQQVPHGEDCNDHPNAVFSTLEVDMEGVKAKPAKLNYMLRDQIKSKSGDYSDLTINLNEKQRSQVQTGLAVVESTYADPYSQNVQLSVLNPGGWDGLNIDRPAGTFEGDICVSDGR